MVKITSDYLEKRLEELKEDGIPNDLIGKIRNKLNELGIEKIQ